MPITSITKPEKMVNESLCLTCTAPRILMLYLDPPSPLSSSWRTTILWEEPPCSPAIEAAPQDRLLERPRHSAARLRIDRVETSSWGDRQDSATRQRSHTMWNVPRIPNGTFHWEHCTVWWTGWYLSVDQPGHPLWHYQRNLCSCRASDCQKHGVWSQRDPYGETLVLE